MYLCIVLSSSLPTYIHIYIYAYQILSIVYIHAPTDELPYHLCESMFKDFRTRSKVISNNQVTRDIPGSYKPSHALLQGRSHWKWTNKWNFKVDSDTFWDIFYSAQVLNRNIYIYICIKTNPSNVIHSPECMLKYDWILDRCFFRCVGCAVYGLQAVGMEGWQVHVHSESVWELYRPGVLPDVAWIFLAQNPELITTCGCSFFLSLSL